MKVVYIIYKSLVKLPQTKIQIINHLHKYLLWVKVQRGHRLRRTGSHASLSCGSHNVGSSTLKKVNNNNNSNNKKKYKKKWRNQIWFHHVYALDAVSLTCS